VLVREDLGMMNCVAPECDRPIRYKALQLCQKHYFRLRRKGTLDAKPIRESRGICIIEGCDKVDTGADGYCMKHYSRFKRNGDPLLLVGPRPVIGPANGTWQGEEIGYTAAHDRVRVRKGKAHDHPCADCGSPAKQWAYDHKDPDDKVQIGGTGDGCRYSTKAEHYEPKCVPCHKRSDLRRLGKALA
jgi:hypothetical protein